MGELLFATQPGAEDRGSNHTRRYMEYGGIFQKFCPNNVLYMPFNPLNPSPFTDSSYLIAEAVYA